MIKEAGDITTNIEVEALPEEFRFSRIGEILEYSAHGMSTIRGIGGITLAQLIRSTPDYQTWGVCKAFVGLAISDIDGSVGRFGRRLQGKDESIKRPFNSYIDNLTDKLLVDSVTEAIAHRERQNGNTLYARSVELASGVFIARDIIATADRVIADFQKIDTRAQKGGKRKTLIQYGVIALALSPPTKNPFVKSGVSLGLAYSARESVKSGLSLHKSFKEQRQVRKLNRKQRYNHQENDCPDFVEY